MNPRAAINDLLPFQGSPFNLLGTSPEPESINFSISHCNCQPFTSCTIKRRGWDSNPCALSDKRFSRPPRYDRFDTSPCISHRDNWYYISGFLSCQPLFSSFFNFFRSLFPAFFYRLSVHIIYTHHTKSLPVEDLPV